jgi:aminoglycoside phosphotransferase (APT) family kinase protein
MNAVCVPDVVADVSTLLLDYLKTRLGVTDLYFTEPPTLIPDGWETYIYRFQLAGNGLTPELARPLILRVYSCWQGLNRLRHEFAVQKYLHERGYPAPRPLIFEKDDSWFGGPFLVMEMIPGRTLLADLLSHFTHILSAPAAMAETQATLHTLPTEGSPCPAGPFLDRSLEKLRQLVREYGFAHLKPGVDWVMANRPGPPPLPSIIHLDYHPLNLIFAEGPCQGVLDWCEADVGDRHADIAVTLLLIDSTRLQGISPLQRLASLIGRVMLRNRYLRAYNRLLPIDKDKLDYYLAWATLNRLSRWGTWLFAGPLSTGSKPSVMHNITSEGIQFLRHYFQKHTGVAIGL